MLQPLLGKVSNTLVTRPIEVNIIHAIVSNGISGFISTVFGL